jgi:hypothetical protein
MSDVTGYAVALVCLGALWLMCFAFAAASSEGEWGFSARLASWVAAVVAAVAIVFYLAVVLIGWIVGAGL